MESDPNVDIDRVRDFEEYYRKEKKEAVRQLLKEFGNLNCSIYIDYQNLSDEKEHLADLFDESPDEALEAAERGLKQYAGEVLQEMDLEFDLERLDNGYVRFMNAGEKEIRGLRAQDLNNPVTVSGVVSKRTDVKPRPVQCAFRCERCYTVQEDIYQQDERGFLRTPQECEIEGCNSTSFDVVYDHDDTEFVDTQTFRLQERPEGLKGGERPREIDVRIEGDITGDLSGGDRVEVTGILRVEEQGDGGTVHDTYLEGLSFIREDKDFEEVEVSDEDEQEIREMVTEYDEMEDMSPLKAVTESIAPSIFGYNQQKEAIALQLFGGVTKHLPDGSRVRGDIHLLLIGDPGTAKSQILQYVDEIAPRSVYSSGKGSSSAGLTAAAVRDDFGDGNEWTLEAGALVLADKGLAAIDELDKMSPEDRSAMHQALEQQEISVAKAGINATMKSRCSLLAAANPKYGRFDQFEPIPDQIDLEPALISRFDLIFTITDDPEEEKDRNLAQHILNSNEIGEAVAQHDEPGVPKEVEEDEEVEPLIEPDMLRKYIAFAKDFDPKLTDIAKEKIENFYVNLRSEESDSDEDSESPVSITARQLEATVRLAEASARIRLSESIDEVDAKIAIETIKATMEDVGYDPEKGEFDVDRTMSSTTSKERNQIRNVIEVIEELEEEIDEGGPTVEDIVDETGKSEDEVREQLEKLKRNGDVYEPQGGGYSRV